MALVTFEAFEDILDPAWTGTTTQFAAGRTGRGLNLGSTVSAVYNPATALTGLVCGCAFKVAAGSTNFTGIGLQFNNTTAAQMSATFDNLGHITIRRGASTGTVVATGTTAFAMNTWNYLEVKISSAGFTDTGGFMEVRMNNVVECSLSGDTLNTTGPAACSAIAFLGQSGETGNYDDFYLCDLTGAAPYNDYLGDCKVEQLLPNGAGASTQWTPLSGANYTNVDESPPNVGTDYVSTAASAQRDLYTLTDMVSTAGVVLAVRPLVTAAKSDAGAEPAMRPVLRGNDGTVKVQTTMPAQGTNYVTRYAAIETAQPNGSAWSITDVNGLQLGQETV